MKKILLYLIVIITIVGLYVGVYFFYLPNLAQSTFEYKRDSLETSIKRQIKAAWNNDNALLYFKEYGGAKYLRMDMDAVRLIDNRIDNDRPPYKLAWDLFPSGRYSNNVRMAFKSLRPGNFNDLYDLYYIQCVPWQGTFIAPDDDPYSIKVFTYTPLFVGYKKETMSLRDYRPSFDKSCKEAKEYIQEEDADNRMYYNAKNEDRVKKIFNLHNDYYYFQFRDMYRTFNPENEYIQDFDFATFNFSNHDINAFPFGQVNWVYNSFYKVYYYVLRIGNMYLTFNDVKYNQDVESYLSSKRMICNIVFLICLGILGYLILRAYYKNKRIKKKILTTKDEDNNNDVNIEEESEIFIRNASEKYDHIRNLSMEKTIIVNDDVNVVSNIEDNNDITDIDTSEIYDKILKLSNPEIFIKPYQPEKLEKANRIYSSALKNKDNKTVLEKLLEEAIQL